MDWISHYQIVLFDFDGLLVDTEPLHYAAYMRMCEERGIFLGWDFSRFSKEAHAKEQGFFEALQREHPYVFEGGITRGMLYEEKKRIYAEMIRSFPLSLMEGVEPVLRKLQEKGRRRAVVTNSPKIQVEWIRQQIPLLQTIPLWITREDYAHAKPAPEGYLKALLQLREGIEAAVGFEDSLKGIQALVAAGVDAVLVGPSSSATTAECRRLGAKQIPRLSLLWEGV